MLKPHTATLAALIFIGAHHSASAAMKLHPPEDISAAAEDFLRAHPFESNHPVDFTLNKISSRLALKQCDEPLEIGFSPNAKQYGNTHLRVKCPSGKKWRINIGVALNVYHDAVVMKHALGRDVVIDSSDLLLMKLPRAKIYTDFYSQVSDIVGLVTTMPLRDGQIVSSRLVSAANLVKKGQSVILVARAGGINITTRGKALNNAQRGETVRVQNKDSGRIVEGIAVDMAKVEIPL